MRHQSIVPYGPVSLKFFPECLTICKWWSLSRNASKALMKEFLWQWKDPQPKHTAVVSSRGGSSKEQMCYPIRFHASINFSMILLNHEGAAGVTDLPAERNLGDHLSSIFVLSIRKMEFWPIKSQIAHKWHSWDQNSSSSDSQGHLPRNKGPFWDLEILLADWRIKWNQ